MGGGGISFRSEITIREMDWQHGSVVRLLPFSAPSLVMFEQPRAASYQTSPYRFIHRNLGGREPNINYSATVNIQLFATRDTNIQSNVFIG